MDGRWLGLVAVAFVIACSDDDRATGGDSNAGGAGNASGTTGQGAAGGGDGAGGAGTTGSGAGGSGTGGGESSGCGDTSAPTGVIDGSIQANGKPRTYVLAVPSGYDPNTPYPLVFAWHGAGGDGALARLYFGVEQQAAGSAIFVYPDGLMVNGNTGWDLTASGDDVQLFDAIYAELGQSHCIDTSRVFSTGHSFGGYMSNSLGCARGDVLRAIAPVAGGGPFFPTQCVGSPAAWLAHGTADNVVEISQGEQSRDHWLSQNGCGTATTMTTPSPCVAYDGCQEPVHWCQHGGGHEWPSFAAAGIWGFFAAMP